MANSCVSPPLNGSDELMFPARLGTGGTRGLIPGLSAEPEPAFGAIAVDGLWRARCVGERNVSIGPHEIKRIARKTRCLMLQRPGELLQCQAVIGAPLDEVGLCDPIDMNLPGHRG